MRLLVVIVYSVIAGFASLGLVLWECSSLGPYTSWFNNRLLDKAEAARLVGRPQDVVVAVLGRPDNTMQYWTVRDRDLRPSPGAKRVTTYEYFPYPFLPMSKFQVHCTDGLVQNLERFDN